MAIFDSIGPRKETVARMFSKPRLVTDSVAFVAASYAISGFWWVVDNVSHTPSRFSHIQALFVASAFVGANFYVSRKFGNVKWFGSKSIAAACLVGSLLANCLLFLYWSFQSGIAVLKDVGFSVFIVPMLAVSIFGIVLIVRLISTPIINVFASDDGADLDLD